MHRVEPKGIYNLGRKPEGKIPLKDLGIGGRIILK
jgi:hypothetical protein